MSKLLRWLMQYVDAAIYVWGGQGEDVCQQKANDGYDPEGWIKSKETNSTNAMRAVRLFRKRLAEGLNPVYCFDCSGLVVEMLKYFGILKPTADMNTKGLYAKCDSHPDKADLRQGDLVFYSKTAFPADIQHVGVYIGNGKVIEAKGRDAGVVKSELTDYPWNMFGRIAAVEPYTVPYTPEQLTYDVTKPVHEGEAYKLMQEALNAGGYADNNGNPLEVDGKWGKRSRQAFDAMTAKNTTDVDTAEHIVTVEIDGCVVAESVICFG